MMTVMIVLQALATITFRVTGFVCQLKQVDSHYQMNLLLLLLQPVRHMLMANPPED